MVYENFIPWDNRRKLNLVQIQTSSHCNGNCIMCPYPYSWYAKNPGYMNDELYTNILQQINEYDPKFSGKFCPYLANEPFSDSKIIERSQEAYDILYHPYIEFSSNMGLLNKNKIDKLYRMFEKNDFYGKFTISHHGISKKSFESTMRGINYEKALDNAIYLLKKFDGQLNRISIFDMAYSIDKKYQINPYRKVERYLNKLVEDNHINRRNLILSPKIFHNRAGNVDIPGWNYKKIIRKIDKQHPFDCLRIHGCLHVIYTGEVIGCCMDYFRETIIGDLNKETVTEYFVSDKYKKWVGMVQGKIESPPNFICRRCTSPGG